MTYTMDEVQYAKMDPEVKAKWLAALRSGDYRQGQQRLRSQEDEFCCLGVLCDIEVPGLWTNGSVFLNDSDGTSPKMWTVLSLGGSLDFTLMEKFGVTEEAHGQLTYMNDRGDSFETIADWIEENL